MGHTGWKALGRGLSAAGTVLLLMDVALSQDTATPTMTPTRTPSNTFTRTPTRTPTMTRTPTSTPTSPCPETVLAPAGRLPHWSPAGDWIVYEKTVATWSQIYKVQASGGSEEALTTASAQHYRPDWSPDGNWIAYQRLEGSFNQIYRVSSSGGAEEALTTDAYDHVSPEWSPDGQWIAYFKKDATGTYQVYKIPASGGSEIALTTEAGGWTVFPSGRGPQWSPDSAWLAYSRKDAVTGWAWNQIYKVSSSGGSEVGLTSEVWGSHTEPRWSPNGEWVSYDLHWCGMVYFVYKVSSVGPVYAHIAGETYEFSPMYGAGWSPDGAWIAYVTSSGSLYRASSVGGPSNPKQQLAAGASDPDWSPDGLRIVYVKGGGICLCPSTPCVCGTACATYTSTSTATSTATPTRTPTGQTATPSSTPTTTNTASPTRTSSPTPTGGWTASPTCTSSRTPTATNTSFCPWPQSPTPTATPTNLTPSPTSPPTATMTRTSTRTPTMSATSTSSPTPDMGTATPTATSTWGGPPVILSAHRDKHMVVGPPHISDWVDITFASETSQTYDIYACADMQTPAWILQGSVFSTGSTSTYRDVGPVVTETYYRIRVQSSGVYSPNEAGVLPMTCVGKGATEAAQGAMLGISLESTEPGGTLQDVIGWQTQGAGDPDSATEIWAFNAATASYKMAWLFDSGGTTPTLDGHWIDPDLGSDSTMAMTLGAGFWVYNKTSSDQVIWSDGLVRRADVPMAVGVKTAAISAHQMGQPFAADVLLNESGTSYWADGAGGTVDPDASDEVWIYNQHTDSYAFAWLFDSNGSVPTMDGWWIDPNTGDQTTAELKRGTSWWFYSKPDPSRAPGWTWTAPVPY